MLLSLVDEYFDKVETIIRAMCTQKGAFHVKAHYSSYQLTYWFCDDPYNYKVFVKEEILEDGFLDRFSTISYEGRKPTSETHQLDLILDEFRRLRLSDEQIYLRSGSINRLNDMISMNFSCDGSHYIYHDEFFTRLQEFCPKCEGEVRVISCIEDQADLAQCGLVCIEPNLSTTIQVNYGNR